MPTSDGAEEIRGRASPEKANFMPVRPGTAKDGRTAQRPFPKPSESDRLPLARSPAYFLRPSPIPTLVMRRGGSSDRPRPCPVRDPRLALILRARSVYLKLSL